MANTIRRIGALLCVCAVLVTAGVGCSKEVSSDKTDTTNISKKPHKTNSLNENVIELQTVMPEGKWFDPVDIAQYALPESVTEVHKEITGKGYVIKLNAKGFNPDMIVLCGVDANNVITGAACLSSNETNGQEKTYGENFVGKDAAGVAAVDTIANSTLTTLAYKNAVKDALNTARILDGEEIDLRTDEEIIADLFDDHFVNDPVVSECSLDGLNANITAAAKTKLGNYVIDVNGLGFGYYGDEAHYVSARNVPIQIRVYLTAEGEIIDCITLYHEETSGFGAACSEETFCNQFDGKTADNYQEVDGIAGATITTNGYMKAVQHCFEAVTILEGGAQS